MHSGLATASNPVRKFLMISPYLPLLPFAVGIAGSGVKRPQS